MSNKNKFEFITVQSDGESFDLPVVTEVDVNAYQHDVQYYHDKLLSAAEIIYTALLSRREGLGEVINDVEQLHANKNISEGILIEDEETNNSIKIMPDDTILHLWNSGSVELPTPLVTDMLIIWNQQSHK